MNMAIVGNYALKRFMNKDKQLKIIKDVAYNSKDLCSSLKHLSEILQEMDISDKYKDEVSKRIVFAINRT